MTSIAKQLTERLRAKRSPVVESLDKDHLAKKVAKFKAILPKTWKATYSYNKNFDEVIIKINTMPKEDLLQLAYPDEGINLALQANKVYGADVKRVLKVSDIENGLSQGYVMTMIAPTQSAKDDYTFSTVAKRVNVKAKLAKVFIDLFNASNEGNWNDSNPQRDYHDQGHTTKIILGKDEDTPIKLV